MLPWTVRYWTRCLSCMSTGRSRSPSTWSAGEPQIKAAREQLSSPSRLEARHPLCSGAVGRRGWVWNGWVTVKMVAFDQINPQTILVIWNTSCVMLKRRSPWEGQGRAEMFSPRSRPQLPQPGVRWGVTYIEQESRDWCEAIYVNQAQTDREVPFPGSNIEKPKKRQRKLNHTAKE